MDKQKKETLIEKVKEFFSSHDIDADVVTKEEVSEKFETVLLEDGVTEVTIEPTVEVGAAIVLTAEDGTPVPAPAGEYILQDGRTVMVEEDGVVASVSEMSEEAPTEEPMSDDQPEKAEQVKRVIERIEKEKIFSRIEALEETLKSKEDEVKFLKEENEVLTTNFNELKTFTKEVMDELLSEPTKEPVQKEKKIGFSSSDSENMFLKIRKK